MLKKSDKSVEAVLLNEETTTSSPSIVVGHNKLTAAPSDNYETVIQFEGQTSTTPNVFLGAIKAIRRVIAHATRRSAVAVYGDFEGDEVQLANLEAPDYEPFAPNARGVGSVDMQNGRFVATSVASGYGATLSGGEDGEASGDYSTVSGGSGGRATGDNSTIPGGRNNLAPGINSTVGGGDTNNAGGLNATVGGGANNEATGLNSAIGGGNGNELNGDNTAAPGGFGNILDGEYSSAVGGASGSATLMGQHVHSVGFFVSNGDSQVSELCFRIESADAPAVAMLINETDRLVLRDNESWSFEGYVSARKTAGGVQHAKYKIEGLIHRNAGVGTTVMDQQAVTTIFEDNAAWAVALTADAVNGALQVAVTGAAVTVIQWAGYIKIVHNLMP